MVLTSFAEILSLGVVLPFLGVLSSPERVFSHPAARPVIELLSLGHPADLLLPLTVAFAAAALLSGAMRLTLLWASTRLSQAAGADLSMSIYSKVLYQPYAVQVARNSSELINLISTKTNTVILKVITPALTLISSALITVAIMGALMAVDLAVALATFGGFGSLYLLIVRAARKRVAIDSRRIAHESTQVIQALREGLGGIRDVLLDGTQPVYCQIYRASDRPLRRAQGNHTLLSQAPRYGMESLGMLLIAVLAYALAHEPSGIASAIPVLGTLALGAQRMLPILQQSYAAWSGIQSGQASLQDVLDLLEQPLPEHTGQGPTGALAFQHEIVLQQLSYRYTPDAPWVLENLNLSIPRGARVGFIGSTGSGKSTLLDIVMGLLEPSIGTLSVDGTPITHANRRAWQAHIAHVPQSVFLADRSIEENIAFGVPADQIDAVRVRQAAAQAQIADTIESWPLQYRTPVGEDGVRLSGGQRQRIGIARALYKRADVIIFDEATSALDNDTEQAVMQAIETLGDSLTILMIAHRLTTLKNCSHVVELADGGIRRIGRYQDIVTQAA